jgi:hypothetical protein
MVPTQDVVRFAAPIAHTPFLALLPSGVVAAVLLATITSLLLVSVRRRDAD